MEKRINIIVSGHVQGVFFRAHVMYIAKKLGLKGFVRNLLDGNVEIIAEGPEGNLKELLEFCKKGPIGARVTNIKVDYEKAKGDYNEFFIV